ncbi:MAG TPA: hypothetical protein VMV92_13435 [Streptosporangiaceae bacterium]|nr:hypothetical protein [Streptosporangiaceae bacterium]
MTFGQSGTRSTGALWHEAGGRTFAVCARYRGETRRAGPARQLSLIVRDFRAPSLPVPPDASPAGAR